MGADSTIEWLGEGGITSSPWEGCTKVHTGCSNCYAEGRNRRWGAGANWGKGAPRRVAKGFWTDVPKHVRKLAALGKRGSLFMSICDPLDPEVWGLDPRDNHDGRADRSTAERVIETVRGAMVLCPGCRGSGYIQADVPGGRVQCDCCVDPGRYGTGGLDWLLLTKRPENAHLVPEDVRRHTWLIYSASDQPSLEMGADALVRAEGFAGLGLSLEPLVGPADVRRWLWPTKWTWASPYRTPEDALAAGAFAEERPQALVGAGRRFVDWVIIGGESGAGARPYDLAWPRSIIAQCRAAGVPVFHKQVGAHPRVVAGEEDIGFLASARYRERSIALGQSATLRLADKKGGDTAEWPKDLDVREFPEGLRRA